MSREPQPPTATDHAFDIAEDMFDKACTAFTYTSNYLQLESKVAAGKHFAYDHPFITLFFALAVTMCSIPVLCFLAFAVGSVCFMFTGFLFIEGVMLSCGLFTLLGILCVVCFFALGASAIVGVTGYIYLYLRNMFNHLFNSYEDKEEKKPVGRRYRHVHIGSHEE